MDPVLAYSRDYNREGEDAPDRAFDTEPMHEYACYRIHLHAYAFYLALRRRAIKPLCDNHRC